MIAFWTYGMDFDLDEMAEEAKEVDEKRIEQIKKWVYVRAETTIRKWAERVGRTPPLLVPGFYEGADNPFEDENEPKSEAEMAAAAVWMERSFVFCVGAALGEWLYRNNMGELWGKNPVSEEFAAKGEEFMTAVAESICHRPALVSAESVFGVIENNKGRIVELLKDGAERFMEKVDVLEEAIAAANGKNK